MTTNYERIKNMTVDEMAEGYYFLITCKTCPMYFKCKSHHLGRKKCFNAIKQWLQAESEE